MEQRKSLMRNQEGFTLIEIIAVLVLLGILAAVAVPKYFDMQETAKLRAADAAVAEGVAQVNQAYAKAFLWNGAVPAIGAVGDAAAAKTVMAALDAGTDGIIQSGDFWIKFTPTAASKKIAVAAIQSTTKPTEGWPTAAPGFKEVTFTN